MRSTARSGKLDQTLAEEMEQYSDSHFQEVFRRLVPRPGVKNAMGVIAHRICRLIWKLLHEDAIYIEQGARGQHPQAIRKRARKLLGDLRRLGYKVPIEEPTPKAA